MARLLVIGSTNADMTVRLPNLPAPGQTVLGGVLQTGPGGKGANQAVAAARAGAEVVFLTAVGDDDLGRAAVRGYRDAGIDVAHVRSLPGIATGVALILVGEAGENMIGVAPGANARLGPADVHALPDALFELDALLVAGLEVPLGTIASAVARARSRGTAVVLNPAPFLVDRDAAALLAGVDVVTPNRGELALATGQSVDDLAGVVTAADRLMETGPRCVVATLGAEGCLVRGSVGAETPRTVWIRAYPVEAVDAVGAGDAFSAALSVALAERKPLVDAACWATAAAALAVTRAGAQAALPTRAEIDRFVATRPPRVQLL